MNSSTERDWWCATGCQLREESKALSKKVNLPFSRELQVKDVWLGDILPTTHKASHTRVSIKH
jgi:hypothetical protein